MSDMHNVPATLLLVDDEPGILSSLNRLLRPAGYTIFTARNGREALAILEQNPVDLVLSDMRMPEMDGAKFLEQVRTNWPGTVRLLLTGYADIASTIDAINRGEIYRYIAKPWDDNDLKLIVRDALESSRLRRENARLLALTQAQNDELRDFNSQLEEKVRQRTAEIEQINSFLNLANERLKQNFLLSIKVFSGLLELRGSHIAGHSRRIAEQARQLAQHMQLDPKTAQDVFCAGLLHDIGKIGFPDGMLQKPPSRLTGEEYAHYRRHTVTGEMALMPLEELKEVGHIVRSHHERFDGQGFPDTLEGEAIPLGARILAVINDYDGLLHGALADKRIPPEQARTMLLNARGKRYDPAIVDAFIDMLSVEVKEVVPEKIIPYLDLQIGMVLARDLENREGMLLLAAGRALDVNLIRHIQTYMRREQHPPAVYIRTDKQTATNTESRTATPSDDEQKGSSPCPA
ncbi:HD domain-containing phosphohydrolase [Propionivibrio limicola]|uniref:HD domain-containing phosphohydrolase n=1 Tax=Propionivibrio limicola TaxID=167645 RepID=UPI0012916635|nr:HD domain-containing phosphohydrolase [Propionivibrio limicola]